MVKKQTALTVEAFQEIIMPQIDKKIDNLRTDISYLPTKEEYYAREDKTMNELKKLREEVSLVGSHYKSTNKRVDLI